MIYSLAEYEFIKNVKITLNSGEEVYCDIEEWIDDDPEGITIKPNRKTTNDWLIGRTLMGMSLNITEISDIMLLDDRRLQVRNNIKYYLDLYDL